jgi:cytochrome b561
MVADALSACLLAGLLAARFRWWLRYSPPASAADIRHFSRGLSRMVYLSLYLIIGVKQVAVIIAGWKYGNVPAQGLGMLDPASQGFLLYGLGALVLIRVLAYLTWRRYRDALGRRGPARFMPRPPAPALP